MFFKFDQNWMMNRGDKLGILVFEREILTKYWFQTLPGCENWSRRGRNQEIQGLRSRNIQECSTSPKNMRIYRLIGCDCYIWVFIFNKWFRERYRSIPILSFSIDSFLIEMYGSMDLCVYIDHVHGLTKMCKDETLEWEFLRLSCVLSIEDRALKFLR